MCGQNREKRVEKCPIPWCRLPPLWLFSCSRIPYKNLSPYNFSMVYLKIQFLVLSTVGLHARTEAEGQVSMSMLPVLETAEDNAAMHQALMAKPKHKKSTFSLQCHPFLIRLWDFTPSPLQYLPLFTGDFQPSNRTVVPPAPVMPPAAPTDEGD